MSRGEIVGQNVKLELIRAHRRANEWLIVITDRQQGGTIWPLCSEFTSPPPASPPLSPSECIMWMVTF